jgi:hypothetical protein
LSTGAVTKIGVRDFRDKWKTFVEIDGFESARLRYVAARRGLEMFQDHWATGWGAGCFQYGFTKYQKREAALTDGRQVRLHWEHVHDDWLESLIELGVVGVLPLAFIIVYWLRTFWRQRLWRLPVTLPVLCGLGALGFHAFIDFPFQNLAVTSVACALLPLIARLGEIENRS